MLSFEELLLHPKTRFTLQSFLQQGTHAILIEAPAGAGKATLIEALSAELGASRPEHKLIVSTESKSIGIDEVKAIQDRLKLKSFIDQKVTILIHNCEKLTREAQNSLLKLLEEPPKNTIFILSTTDKNKLLPTVRSRAVQVTLMKPSRSDAAKHFKDEDWNEPAINSALAISDGWIGLSSTILGNKETDVNEAINEAKKLLGLPLVEKLSHVDVLTKRKAYLETFFYGLERILHSGLHSARLAGRDLTSWQTKLMAVTEAQTGYRQNLSTRLLLTKLMLNL